MTDTNLNATGISTSQVWLADAEVLQEAVEHGERDKNPDAGTTVEDDMNVRVISITGSLNDNAGPLARMLGKVASPSKIRAQALKAKSDDSVDAVALYIDSPGGSVTGIPLAAEAIADLSEEKPVRAYIKGMGTSGAYWLASQADEIHAAPASSVGSIGAVAKIKSVSDRLEEEGIDVRVIRSAEMKAKPNASEQIDEESVEVVQRRVNRVHDNFVDAIQAGRKWDEEKAESLADGRYYLGEKAAEIGLVDSVTAPDTFLEDFKDSISSEQNSEQATMPQDETQNDDSDSLEARVDSLTDTVETLTEAVSEMAGQPDGDTDTEVSDDAEAIEAKARTLIERHSDRVAPGEEDQIIQIAKSAGLDQAEAFIQRLEPVVDDGAPDTQAEDTQTASYDEMEKFPEDNYIGRNDNGKMIATNEEDAKVFAMLDLDYEDATA